MFSSRKTSGLSASTSDPQFNYVTALLHGDGTNGAQNNTFLDSSSNAFTITRNGTPTQGSFSPYGTLWSNYFDGGSSTRLTFPSNSAFAFGTGAYTVEAWVYATSYAATQGTIFDAGTSTGSFDLTLRSSGAVSLGEYGGGGSTVATSSSAVGLNQWIHIAAVRDSTSSNATRIYVNGVLSTTGTDSNNYTVTTVPAVGGINLGGYTFIGYISNLRVVKGTAVYTSAFTPSTTPLTAITNTSLLTCQSNNFIDNSSNAFAITVNGSISVQRFNPFLPTSSQAYSTSVYGGSGYFNGSTDYLSAPSNSAFNLTGDFTFECWFNSSNGGSISSLLVEVPATGGLQIYFNGGNLTVSAYGVISFITYAYQVPSNTWVHLALVRSGTGTNNLVLYLNGISVATASNNTTNFAQGAFRIGGTSFYFNGYISDVRLVKGTAVYTSNFTPPTSPLTSITNTSILTNMTNAGIYDNAMMNDFITVGSAQINTSVKKYGTGSISFNGSTDQLNSNSPNTNLYAFGTGDFTIEMWFYAAGGSGSNTNLYDSTPSGGGVVAPQIYIIGSPWTIRLYGGSAGPLLDSGFTVSTGTWYHLAICRASGNTKIFVNGTQQGSTLSDSNNYTNGSQRPVIGAWGSGSGNYFNGYIDDLRVTKGYARYTSNFTPPTSALPNY
jgi:hypothetical protein